MIRLQEALIRLNSDLQALRLRWALIGGLAVSVHVEPRTTRDLDVAVVVSGDREAERIIIALRSRGYRDYPFGAGLERRDMERMAGYRFIAPGEDEHGLLVNVLFAFSGVEPEIVGSAQILEVFPNVAVFRISHEAKALPSFRSLSSVGSRLACIGIAAGGGISWICQEIPPPSP